MLITLDEAKRHLRIRHDEEDEDIQELVDDASDIVLDYLKMAGTAYQSTNGDPEDVPGPIRAAVKLMIGGLYENREGSDYAVLPQPLSEAIKSLLHRFRTPAMA